MKKTSLLICGFAMLISLPSFAACEAEALSGVWTRSEADGQQPGSGITWNWDLTGEGLITTIQYEDSWTASGQGPYFEKEIQYTREIDSNCVLTRTAVQATERSLREFDEPKEDVSEKTYPLKGTSSYTLELSQDENRLTVIDESNRTTTVFSRVFTQK